MKPFPLLMPVLILISLLVFLDRYLSANDSTWSFVLSVWPMWLAVFSMGSVLCFMVLFSYLNTTIRRTLDAQYQTESAAYRQSVNQDTAEEKQRLVRQKAILSQQETAFYQEVAERKQKLKNKLKAKERELDAKLKEAHEFKADAERLIIETKAENEKHRQSSFNATNTVERFRRKLARQGQSDTASKT